MVSSAAAAPAPAWEISVVAYPSSFAPGSTGSNELGPGYAIVARNTGGAPTTGQFRISDTLPTGVALSPVKGPTAVYGPERPGGAANPTQQMTCAQTGQVLTCSGEGPLNPGEEASVRIPLEVPAATSGSLFDEAVVEGGGAAPDSTSVMTEVSEQPIPFGFLDSPAGAFGRPNFEDGSAATQAGSHPYQLTVGMGFKAEGLKEPGDTLHIPNGGIRDISADLPQGFVVNPQATPKCTEVQLESTTCPNSTQVGTVRTVVGLFNDNPVGFFSPLYNMVAPPGHPAVLGFEVIQGTYVHLLGGVRSDGDYGLSAEARNIPAKIGVVGAEVNLWGDPSDPSHDSVRDGCTAVGGLCTTERLDLPFLTLPSSCPGSPLETALGIDSWDGAADATSYANTDSSGNPLGVDGCNQLQFEPSVAIQPTTNLSDSPSGLHVDIHQPQNESVKGLATANLRDARVTLPPGMAVNPSAANGLAACSKEQIGYAPAEGKIRFNRAPQQCPDGAKLGSVEVTTPLLDHKLPGSVFLAAPHENPFGTLLALYLAVEDPRTGIVAKLAGRVDPDPQTGQLTALFTENPELPLEDIELSFFNGPRGALTTPLSCGSHTAVSDLTPWSTPEGADAHLTSSFDTSASPTGAGCPADEAQAPNTPSFSAGTLDPSAGSFSPFVLKIGRADGTQRIAAIDTMLPPGLTGKLAGVPYCPEQALAAAAATSGRTEETSSSCPAASQVGTVVVGAGAGISPYYVTAHAYLAGPYKDAPISLAIVTPAVAGPFDLGVVVTRVALYVNPTTAQIHAVSDPLPTILQGLPLDVRSIALRLGRSDFTLNPTSCEPMSVSGSVASPAGVTGIVTNRFQVGGCSKLRFKPQLKLSLKGPTKRAGHPALKAVVTYPQKGAFANIASAQVGLPHSEFLDQGNIGDVCTQPQLKAQTCPKSSVYGWAKAWTPLLDHPLEGPVYLGVGYGHQLPDMVADLNGQIRILLHGRVDTTKQKGLRNTFEVVPDAPVSRFVLELKGGKRYGLLLNSENICRRTQRASAHFVAQNGEVEQLHPKIKNSCKGNRSKRHGKHRR